jgi:general secretion pathway protein D
MGTGNLVGRAPATDREGVTRSGGDVTLNFEAADLQEVAKTIFQDILEENYEIDPEVRGSVTLHTTMPVTREAVLPILESILQSNGAALVRGAGIYKVVTAARAGQNPAPPTVGNTPTAGAVGYGVQVVPLRFVAAAEIKKILDPLVVEPAKVEIDATRNAVVLSGPRLNVQNLVETIQIFDVDWFEGMSFGMFPLEYADVGQISEEIGAVLGVSEQGPMAGIVKLIPVQRLNALIAVTHQPKHLQLVADLVEHFDRGTQAGPGRRLFVYNLRHAEAEGIATILRDIFGAEGKTTRTSQPSWARSPIDRPDFSPAARAGIESGLAAEASGSALALPDLSSPREGGGDRSPGRSSEGAVSIKADTKNNALLVLASSADYRAVEAAIAKLDVPARQVLIEATIAEVLLSENMSYGIRWFFDWGISGYRVAAGLGAPLPQEVGGQGLSMAIFNNAGEVRLFFDILGAETKVKFLSAPQVVVVDNETANFRVGDQIPVVTRASQSTTSPDAPVVTEVEYRDTGTLLTVKPRINAGGMVTLAVSQEVSTPGASTGGANPPIAQRNINSTVVVQSGQTVVLGGLIRENKAKSKSGVPGLMDVPLVGGLFRSTTDDTSRSELIVTVTPRVIKNPHEYREATEEIRRRVQGASNVEQSARR